MLKIFRRRNSFEDQLQLAKVMSLSLEEYEAQPINYFSLIEVELPPLEEDSVAESTAETESVKQEPILTPTITETTASTSTSPDIVTPAKDDPSKDNNNNNINNNNSTSTTVASETAPTTTTVVASEKIGPDWDEVERRQLERLCEQFKCQGLSERIIQQIIAHKQKRDAEQSIADSASNNSDLFAPPPPSPRRIPAQFTDFAPPYDIRFEEWLEADIYGIKTQYLLFPTSQNQDGLGSSACSLISLENVRIILEEDGDVLSLMSSANAKIIKMFPWSIAQGNRMYKAIQMNYPDPDMACNVSSLLRNGEIFSTITAKKEYFTAPDIEDSESVESMLKRIFDDLIDYIRNNDSAITFATGVLVSSPVDNCIGMTLSLVIRNNNIFIFDSHSVFYQQYSVLWWLRSPEEAIAFLLNYLRSDSQIVEFYHIVNKQQIKQ